MNNYWRITTTKGETIDVAPQYATEIKRQMDSGATHLNSKERLRINSIESFRETDRPYIDTAHQLSAGELTEAQTAFGPIITEEGVKCIAVKKQVPTSKRDYYQKVGYTLLSEDEMLTVAFWIPANNFDGSYMQKCTKEEAGRIRQYTH